MLTIDSIQSGYGGAPVLRGVTFAMSAGEIVGIIGHNGMGKTTLMRTLLGLLPTNGGQIGFLGERIDKMSAHARSRLGIGYTPQGGYGFPTLTVRENLTLAAAMPSRTPRKSIDEMMVRFPRLSPLLDRPSGALSGGERQLLALARAMIRSPGLLLLDELTEGVQPSVTDEIAEHLLAAQRSEGTAMIIADQDLSFVSSLVSRALVMQKGIITVERGPKELLRDDVFGDFSSGSDGFISTSRSDNARPVSRSSAGSSALGRR